MKKKSLNNEYRSYFNDVNRKADDVIKMDLKK
jgi:hypothetical protein